MKAYVAEILSHFDLIAIQEVRRDLAALDDVKKLLGPNWDYMAADVTEGTTGNDEHMAFLFNRDKVWFRWDKGCSAVRLVDPLCEKCACVDYG